MRKMDLETAATRAADLIKQSSYAVALTGAGISVPSGIPDFRSTNTGLWARDNPMEVASLSAFRYRPEKFFNWLRPLVQQIFEAQPNPAHHGLAQLEKAGYLKAVVTQNIDGLHQRAGSQEVIEVHGSIDTLRCYQCQQDYSCVDFTEAFILNNEIPHCPQCHSILKPTIVLFEEMLPGEAWSRAYTHFSKADLVLVIGSSLEVTPAATLPLHALENDARLIIMNLTPTRMDAQANLLLPFDAAELLPKITALF